MALALPGPVLWLRISPNLDGVVHEPRQTVPGGIFRGGVRNRGSLPLNVVVPVSFRGGNVVRVLGQQ